MDLIGTGNVSFFREVIKNFVLLLEDDLSENLLLVIEISQSTIP